MHCFLDEKHLMANGVWQTAHRFGKWHTVWSISIKPGDMVSFLGESIVGEIKRYNFFTGHFEVATFRLAKKKFGKIDPC